MINIYSPVISYSLIPVFLKTSPHYICFFFFFFNDTATTEIYTLSLHDALPISDVRCRRRSHCGNATVGHHARGSRCSSRNGGDRKSTRLNSSHSQISYAVFCLKKKK